MKQINPLNPDSSPGPKQETKVESNAPMPAQPTQEGKGIQRRFNANSIYPSLDKKQTFTPRQQAPTPAGHHDSRFRKYKKYIYLVLLLILAVTFFTRNNIRNVTTINSESLKAPAQTETQEKEFIYNHKGVDYEVNPIFEYELNGMVVSRLDYERMLNAGDYADNTLFPIDLCMIWGENISSGIYRLRSTSFSQGGRWCTWSWRDETKSIVNEAIANSHLIFVDPKVKQKMKGIRPGDQIKIIGKLVNVRTVSDDVAREKVVTRNSSTVRTDTGDRSCEDILVEDIVVLQKNTNISQPLFTVSLVALGVLILTTPAEFLLKHIRR